MLSVNVPGYKQMELKHLVLDYNGTLALDGKVLDGVLQRLDRLSGSVKIHVLTADTFGGAREELAGLDCSFHVIPEEGQARAKSEYVRELGEKYAAAVGNGRNDALMLERAELGIALLLEEGAAVSALSSGDIVCRDIKHALDLLLYPMRLKATLRA